MQLLKYSKVCKNVVKFRILATNSKVGVLYKKTVPNY